MGARGPRHSWQESLAWLQGRGFAVPAVQGNGLSSVVSDRPRPEQKDFRGLRFADAVHEEVDFEDLTLPRTLVERCRFHGVSFRNTDLSLSCLDGNDWIDCDFTDARLICVSLCKGVLFGCRFRNCQLIGSDLRGATLSGCDFTGADLTGTKIDRALKESLVLSEPQRSLMVDWRAADDEGPDEEEADEE